MASNLKRRNTERVRVAVASAVSAGTITREGGIIGVPVDNCPAGGTVAFVTNGVVTLTNTMGNTTIATGSNIYWDTSAAAISIGAANDDYFIGKAITGAVANAAFDIDLTTNERPYGQMQS